MIREHDLLYPRRKLQSFLRWNADALPLCAIVAVGIGATVTVNWGAPYTGLASAGTAFLCTYLVSAACCTSAAIAKSKPQKQQELSA